MAIPGQTNINIGQPNQSSNSDTLWQAFNTIQNNFTQLFTSASPIATIAGNSGITVTATTPSTSVITNTGVTRLTAGNNITITNANGVPSNTGELIINSTGGGGGGSGTVTLIGATSNTLNITNTPVVTAGNINVELPNLVTAGNYVSPSISVDAQGRITNISNGVGSGTVTSVGLVAGNGISVAGGPITSAGNITVTNTGVTSIVAGTGVTINQGTGAVTISASGGGGGGGTVTRVGILSNTLNVSGSPIISSGNILVDIPTTVSLNLLNSNIANVVTLLANQLIANNGNSLQSTVTTTYSANTSNISTWLSQRNRGTPGSTLPVQVGDSLLTIEAQGRGSFGQYQYAADITIVANALAANSNVGLPSEIHLNTVDSSNVRHTVKITQGGGLTAVNTITNTLYTNTGLINTSNTARARGTRLVPGNLIATDYIYRQAFFSYTSNGLRTIDGVSGYSYSGDIAAVFVSPPLVPGSLPSTNLQFTVTNAASNSVSSATFTSSGNFNIPGQYIGGGAGLYGIPGSNITGQVGFAAVANSVSGGNVSGAVAESLVAQSVAGANVTGTVARAAIAEVANLVAGANVTGTVGNAFNVITPSQPNITSVGTLTSLAVTGALSCGSLSVNTPASANTTATVVATIPVVIGGTTYKLMLAAE